MAEFKASFRIMKTDLEPSEISTMLGLTPDHSHKMGEPRIGKSGRHFSDFSEGLWELQATPCLSESLTAQVAFLTERLKDRSAALEQLRRLGYEMDVFVGVFDEGGNTTFTLETGAMLELARLGLEIVFDVYS